MLLSSALISRTFGASGLAEIGLLMFYSSFVLIFAAVFGGSSIVYISSKHSVHSIFIVSTITAITASLFISPIILFLPQHIVSVGWLLVVSVFQAFYTNMLFFLLAKNYTSTYNYIRLLQPILLLVATVLMIFVDVKNIDLYYYALTVSYLIPSIFILFILRLDIIFGKKLIKTDLTETALAFFRFGGISQLTNGIQLLNYRISLIIIAFFCSQKDVGIMVLALTFVDGIWMFKNSAGLIKYVDTSKSNGEDNVKGDILYLSMLSLVVTIIVSVAFLLIPNQFYEFVFGKDFENLKQLLVYMLPGVLFISATSIIANYFSGLGKVLINLIVAIVGLLVFLPSVYLLTNKFGIKGAAMANNVPNVVGSLILLFVYMLFAKRKRSKVYT